jgi:hypothetical protein
MVMEEIVLQYERKIKPSNKIALHGQVDDICEKRTHINQRPHIDHSEIDKAAYTNY